MFLLHLLNWSYAINNSFSFSQKSNGETETSETSVGFKERVRVQILDWFEAEDVVVGEGEFCSDEPMYKIGRVPIGPNAVAVIVTSALSSEAYNRCVIS